jgi:hypothetical protein
VPLLLVCVPAVSAGDPRDVRARRALAVIDGTAMVKLRDGQDGYRLRRPQYSYGAPHVVGHLQHAIAEVRALFPRVHTLAIGDLSAPEGGRLANHLSHQTGVDVDVGLYFTKLPAGYPDRFAPANDDLDLEATWALITAFARSSDLPTGVQVMFLDYDIQARLHAWARKRGTPDTQLADILQYPRGRDAIAGMVRHWPSHTDHLHVRFKAR